MSFSLTKITTHEKCALKYKFRYILHLPETKGAAATRGVDRHKSVEMNLLTGAALPPDLSHYESWLAQMRGPNAFPEHKIAVNSKWELVGFDDPDAFMRSVLDLKYVVSPQTVAVYDWKTGKVYPDHDDQKKLYAAMTFAEHPDIFEIKSIHVYLDLGQNREMGFHRDQIPELQQSWNARADAVLRDSEHIPSPGYGCKWCGYSRVVGGPCRF
jgi:hypothetical protein